MWIGAVGVVWGSCGPNVNVGGGGPRGLRENRLKPREFVSVADVPMVAVEFVEGRGGDHH